MNVIIVFSIVIIAVITCVLFLYLFFFLIERYAGIVLQFLRKIKLVSREELVPEEVKEIYKEIQIAETKLCADINSIPAKQFRANLISIFKACLAVNGKMESVPSLESAFPIDHDKPIPVDAVTDVVKEAIDKTNLTKEKIDKIIDEYEKIILGMQERGLDRTFRYENIREIIGDVQETHKIFNETKIIHEEELIKVFEEEGFEIYPIEGLQTLASIIRYKNKEGESKHAVLIKSDGHVHQSLKEFALAHELGHWFLHIKDEKLGEHEEIYLHSLHNFGRYEEEADRLAMILLFPTRYLIQCDSDAILSEELLLKSFTSQMDKKWFSKNLEDYWLNYLKRRIEIYRYYIRGSVKMSHFKDLYDTPLEKDHAEMLTKTVFADFNWARLDSKQKIISASEGFAELIGYTKEELEKDVNLFDFISEEAKKTVVDKLKERKESKTTDFYISKYKNRKTNKSFAVSVCAFPINDKEGKYIGSLGIITDAQKIGESLT